MTSQESTGQRAAWSPAPGLIATAWVLAAGTLAWTVFGTRPAGQLLTALATLGLALFAVFGTVARPRLAVDAEGIVLRHLRGRQRWPWGRVRISVSSTRRFGRRVSLLELDGHDEHGAEALAILGWLDLGTDPDEVAAALRARRP